MMVIIAEDIVSGPLRPALFNSKKKMLAKMMNQRKKLALRRAVMVTNVVNGHGVISNNK
jgi:hypothetical protein